MSTNSASSAKFDELIEALRMAGAEGGTFSLLVQEKGTVTHLLLDMSERSAGVCNIHIHVIASKDNFMYKLRDYLGEEDIDVNSEDVHDAAWEVLDRFKTVSFTEF